MGLGFIRLFMSLTDAFVLHYQGERVLSGHSLVVCGERDEAFGLLSQAAMRRHLSQRHWFIKLPDNYTESAEVVGNGRQE